MSETFQLLNARFGRDHTTQVLTNITIKDPINNQKMIKGIALWDTGAVQSCIDNKVVTELELKSSNKKLVGVVGEKKMTDRYLYTCDVYLKKDIVFEKILLIEMSSFIFFFICF